ncbi:hypothetical protein AVEN_193100-1 [Araneus ventricosus]|uniref:Uncharacterized protein n=1 Tax=Araneus ventricosus TaxID=182803 RepID=A0A4Y2B0M9_ARAVE|nr:hypothetical protein AVEN_193100-1 [Araneus ventricosus]
MKSCRFSHVEGCSQTALCRVMQRSAICVSTWAICCRGNVKPFQVRGKWAVSCKKTGFLPFPNSMDGSTLGRMLNVDLSVSSSSQSDCQSSIVFFLKIDFRKEIGALTESGSLSDRLCSFFC